MCHLDGFQSRKENILECPARVVTKVDSNSMWSERNSVIEGGKIWDDSAETGSRHWLRM